MEKDFNNWNEEKKKLHYKKADELPFHEREVWWCSIGVNIGDEQDGKNELFERPVLVIRKFNRKLAWVLPMSTKAKPGIYYYEIRHNGRAFSVILSQLRLISVKRFRRFIRKIPPSQSREIKARLRGFLGQDKINGAPKTGAPRLA